MKNAREFYRRPLAERVDRADGTMEYKTRWATECVYACATNVLPNCRSAHWRRNTQTCRLSPRDRLSTNFTLKSDTYNEMYEKYIPGESNFI